MLKVEKEALAAYLAPRNEAMESVNEEFEFGSSMDTLTSRGDRSPWRIQTGMSSPTRGLSLIIG